MTETSNFEARGKAEMQPGVLIDWRLHRLSKKLILYNKGHLHHL